MYDLSGLYQPKQESENKIDWIKLLSFLWGIIIFYSLIFYVAYYDYFNIEIIQYLNITEIPFLIFNKSIGFVFIIITTSMGTIPIFTNPKARLHIIYLLSQIILLVIAIIAASLLIISPLNDYINQSLLYCLVTVVFPVFMLIIKYSKHEMDKAPISLKALMGVLFLMVALTQLTIYIGYLSGYRNTQSLKVNNNIIIFNDNSKQLIDKAHINLIPTSDYIFIYDKDSNFTRVIKKDNIKEILYSKIDINFE